MFAPTIIFFLTSAALARISMASFSMASFTTVRFAYDVNQYTNLLTSYFKFYNHRCAKFNKINRGALGIEKVE